MSSIIAASLMLAVSPVEAPRPAWAGYTVIAPNETADDLWARALWVSALSHTWADAPEGLADRLFAAALERAAPSMRSQILVSMGDNGVFIELTATAIRSSWQEIDRQSVQATARALRTLDTATELAAVPGQAEALAESLGHEEERRSTERLQSIADRFLAAMSDARDRSRTNAVVTYSAAVEEDPQNVGAWFRLVWLTEGRTQDENLAELRERDPDNALPWIATGAVQIRRGDIPAAVAPLQAAVKRPVCRLYPSPRPEQWRLRFGNDEPFRKAKVVGRAVPESVFRHVLRSSEEMSYALGGSLQWESEMLETLGWSARDYIAASVKIGRTEQAEAVADATYQAGLKLLSSEPPEPRLFINSLLAVSTIAPEAVIAYRLAGKQSEATHAQSFVDRVNETVERRREILPALPAEDVFGAVLRGELDLVAEWEEFVRTMRGLLDPSTQQ